MNKSFLTAFLIFISFQASANDSAEAKVLQALCQYENANLASHMNSYFLSKLPVKKLTGILNSFKKEEGTCITIEKVDQHNFLYTTEKSQRAMQLYLDDKSKVRGLWFGNATAFSDGLSNITKDFSKLGGSVSVSLIKNNKTSLISVKENEPLSVGMSSALFVLDNLNQKIKKTKLSWSSVLRLKNQHRSIPGPGIYSWAESSPVTLQSMATILLSQSDTTAFDHLLSTVGRKRLESASKRNKPFLTSLELYKLRSEEISFKGMKLTDKRKVLKELSKKPVAEFQASIKPGLEKETGWFFSTKELCRYFYNLRKLAFINVNSGLAQRRGWDFSAFKMGSGPGLLQYTQLVTPVGSKDLYCLSITWNNPDGVQSSRLDALVGRIFSKLK